MVASTDPRPKPTAISDTMSMANEVLRPVATSASGTMGPTTRSTGALPTRAIMAPAATLPRPATTGTSASSPARAVSVSAKRSWSVGMRVTSAAKHSPWAP